MEIAPLSIQTVQVHKSENFANLNIQTFQISEGLLIVLLSKQSAFIVLQFLCVLTREVDKEYLIAHTITTNLITGKL